MTDAFKLLVFDWDGTLADSVDGIVDCLRSAASDLELPPRSREQLLAVVGLGLDAGMAQLYPDTPGNVRTRLAAAYRDYYRHRAAREAALYPAAAGIVRRLHADGYLLAVATGKSRRGLDLALRQSGLGACFHASRCADETFSKPHPAMLEEIMDILGTDRVNTLMIGDSQHDLEMAANAGVKALAVDYGAQSREHLLKFRPLDCLSSLAQLPQWLTGQDRTDATGAR